MSAAISEWPARLTCPSPLSLPSSATFRGTAIVCGRRRVERADCGDDLFGRRPRPGLMAVECLAHGGDMLRCRSATSADDARAGIDRKPRIFCHQVGRAVVDHLFAADFRNAAIGLRHDDGVGILGCHLQDGYQQIRCADPAIGAMGMRFVAAVAGDFVHRARVQPHHRLAGRVETAGEDIGQAGRLGRFRGCLDFLGRRHGFDPDHVDAALLQTLYLFGERLDGALVGQLPERKQQFSSRADGTGNDDLAAGLGRRLARQFGAKLVQFDHPVLRVMQFQAMAGAAECIAQDEIGTGFKKAAMQRQHLFWLLGVPQFRRIAGFQSVVEEVRSCRTVGKQDTLFVQELDKHGDTHPGKRRRAVKAIDCKLI